MPKRASAGSAAYDVFVPSPYCLKYGRQVVKLGFQVEMPPIIALDDRSRSGYTLKGLLAYDEDGKEYRIDADVELGLIDSDYRGEVGALLIVRDSEVVNRELYLIPGQAIAQMKFCYVPPTNLILTDDELSETERGDRGFGKLNNE